MEKTKRLTKVGAFILALAMALSVKVSGITAYADNPDPKTLLTNAFTAFDANEMVFVEYSLTGEGELLSNEKIELDRAHNIKNILSKDIEFGAWNTLYTDLKEQITYYKEDDQWYKYPTDADDLVGLGKTLTENGIETKVVDNATYTLQNDEKKSVTNSHTGVATDFDCYVIKADIPVVIVDDGDLDEADEDNDEEEADEADDPSEEKETQIIVVYYYIAKDTGAFVYAETRDGMIVNVNVAYPSKDDPAAVTALEIPQEAIENAIIEEGYEMPANVDEDIRYKVAYKGKKAYLVVIKGVAKKKLTVPKTYKLLGKAYPVQEIAASAFSGNKKLQTLVINADVTKIDKKAFYNAKKLKTITIKSKKLKTIGKNSFDTYSKKLTVKLSGNKKYKTKITKLINKSMAKKAKKKIKLKVK